MNNQIFYFLYNLAHHSYWADQAIIFFAHTFPYLVIIVAGVFILMHHEVIAAEAPAKVFLEKKKEILRAFVTGGGAWVLAKLLKVIIHTPRPFNIFADVHPLIQESGFAFPSGHATFYMALAVSIFLSHKKAGYAFMAFALIIGVARVAAGVHFPVDIIGGFALGALVAYLAKNV
jgi:membrane-associated phospholipid phosphatase